MDVQACFSVRRWGDRKGGVFLFFLWYDELGRVEMFTSDVMAVRAVLERGALGEDCRLVNQ